MARGATIGGMRTYLAALPTVPSPRPRALWCGWGISLLVHAVLGAWLLHAVLPQRPAALPAAVPARLRFVLVAPRARPVAQVADVQEAPTRTAPAASAVRAQSPRAASTIASPHAADPPAERPALITADTPAASAAAPPSGDSASATAAGAPDAAPAFDIAGARTTARLIEKHRRDGLVAFPKPDPPLHSDDRLGRAIERAHRGNCSTAYSSSGLGLLAVIPLIKDTVTGTGCKW